MKQRSVFPIPSHAVMPPAVLLGVALALGGCQSPMKELDARVARLVEQTSTDMGGDARPPSVRLGQDGRPTTATRPGEPVASPHAAFTGDPTAEQLSTLNPSAGDLQFQAATDAQLLISRLDQDTLETEGAVKLDLTAALAYSIEHAREYRFAEEDYVLAGLRLLIERHLWGPRLFDELVAEGVAIGDGGTFDSSLRIVNELRATQRLPWGGEASARLLARATEDLHRRVAGEETQSAELILAANVPLLRGAGTIAREDRIQAEREMIYAARAFETFRRRFLVEVAADFLDLVVQKQAIENAERQVRSFEELEARERSLVESGRQAPFEAALAEQDTLFARDRLNGQREQYRLAVDRFKVRLGMDPTQPVEIVESTLALPVPDVQTEQAVAAALLYRLDLQTERDRVDDARRAVMNATNLLLPDLNVGGSISLPTDPSKSRGGLDLSPDDAIYRGGVTFGLPLDREIERARLRQSQIQLERSVRGFEEFRDTLAVQVRSSLRAVERALFSLDLQERNVATAETRIESIRAAEDRATARDRSEAVDALARAQDELDLARRDLEIAILQYLLTTGQLRVEDDGTLRRLPGMG